MLVDKIKRILSCNSGSTNQECVSSDSNILTNPPQKCSQCSTKEACGIEEVNIKHLEVMIELDKQFSKKLDISQHGFNDTWNSITKNISSLDSKIVISEFKEERKKVIDAFKNKGKLDERQDALDTYQDAVNKELNHIMKKHATNKKDIKKVRFFLW